MTRARPAASVVPVPTTAVPVEVVRRSCTARPATGVPSSASVTVTSAATVAPYATEAGSAAVTAVGRTTVRPAVAGAGCCAVAVSGVEAVRVPERAAVGAREKVPSGSVVAVPRTAAGAPGAVSETVTAAPPTGRPEPVRRRVPLSGMGWPAATGAAGACIVRVVAHRVDSTQVPLAAGASSAVPA